MGTQNLQPQTENLQSKIKHIVVLMMENRSFDNLLGWLYDGETPPNNQQFEGLTPNLWNPLNNIDSDGNPFIEKVPIAKNGAPKTKYGKPVANPEDFSLPNPDPGEGYADTTFQLFSQYKIGELYPPEPVNMGFVQNYNNAMLFSPLVYGDTPTDPRKIMTTYTPQQTPVLSQLAKSFAVCDHYYASVPSQTLPNRSFIHAATSGGNVNNDPNAFCSGKTIYNQIQDAIDAGHTSLSWKIFGNNMMSTKPGNGTGKFGKDSFSLTRLAMTQLHDAKYDDNFGTLDDFYDLCKSSALPCYTFLEPNFGGEAQNDQHPAQDIRPGEHLMADIYNVVKASPAFNETLLIITYDEHGGCYDHVAPPKAVNPDPADTPGQQGFRFNRYGLRVPCVLINPYIPTGTIARPAGETPYDHTSVIKTVQNCFGLDPVQTARSKVAPDLSGALILEQPRTTDIPSVTPQPYTTKVNPKEPNGLHRQMSKMLSKLTGADIPSDEDMLEFIQVNYNIYFRGGKTTNKGNKKKK